MAIISEYYVSFETAKLLKEKGFDNISLIMYKENGEICINPKSVVSWRLKYWYPCLTLQTAMKWLREVQNLFVFPFPQMNTNKFWAEIYQLSDNQEWENLYCESIDLQAYPTYEQACEAAIKYCLENLI